MFKKCFVIIPIIFIVFASAFILLSVNVVNVSAAVDLWGNQESTISNIIGLGEKDPRLITASIVNIFLGFTGMIAVVIIFLGGIMWMIAGGNEEKLIYAKGVLVSGVIGLIIVLSSWAIVIFLLGAIYESTITPLTWVCVPIHGHGQWCSWQ